MAGNAYSKAVVQIFTIPVRFASVAGALAARARFRMPQAARILRVTASHRLSDATACAIDVLVGAVSLLSAPLSTITAAPPGALTGEDKHVNGLVELGAHTYKVVFGNATGHTEAGTISAAVTPAAPTTPVAALAGAGAGNVTNGTHSWKVTNVSAAGESVASAKSNVLNVADKTTNGQVTVTIAAGPAGTTSRKIYRTVTGDGGNWKLVGSVANNVDLTFTDNLADGGLGADAPAAAGSRVSLTAIPLGPAGTTHRDIYRTVTGGAGDHLLVGTLADNTTRVLEDNIADGALGAAAPTANTFSDGAQVESVLGSAAGDGVAVAKEAEVTVDVSTLTGTSVSDLSVGIDYVVTD